MKEQLLDGRGSKPPFANNTVIPSNSFITGAELAQYFQITAGTVINSDTNWYSVEIDNKYLIVPLLPIRYGINWAQLYQKGLVYGTNDNGKYPSGTACNQLRTIKINGRIYKVRLLKGSNADPTPALRGYSLSGTSNSEFNRIFMPISAESTPLYTGPKLASYTKTELGFTSSVGSWTICIESETPSYTLSSGRGYDSCNRVDGVTKTLTSSANIGWRPCLELIP